MTQHSVICTAGILCCCCCQLLSAAWCGGVGLLHTCPATTGQVEPCSCLIPQGMPWADPVTSAAVASHDATSCHPHHHLNNGSPIPLLYTMPTVLVHTQHTYMLSPTPAQPSAPSIHGWPLLSPPPLPPPCALPPLPSPEPYPLPLNTASSPCFHLHHPAAPCIHT